MKIWSVVRSSFYLALGMATVVACSGSAWAQTQKAADEPCGSLFGSKVCTSYQMRDGKITQISLKIPVAAIENAPPNPAMVWPPHPDLNVPFAPVVRKQTGFTFASIWWEAHGHPPAAFMTPHFDLHFYFTPEKEIGAVTCKDTVKPRVLPAGYVLPDITDPHIGKMVGACVPAMGMHAIPTADMTMKNGWDASMILGYYDGKPTFLEPMVSSAFLLKKKSFSLPIPQGIAAPPDVRYPKSFKAIYEPESKEYDLTLFY